MLPKEERAKAERAETAGYSEASHYGWAGSGDGSRSADEMRALGRILDQGYLYQGLKPVNWCFDCGSALAEAEIPHAWDGDEVVVPELVEADVDALFDELDFRATDTRPASADDGAAADRALRELNRVTARWMRYELIVIDEMAYVAMPEAAAEYLFQIISGRAERASVIVTTNLPFSEWTTMFPNARLCKAMLDRLTDQAHIIETGNESHRFRRTLASRKGGKR